MRLNWSHDASDLKLDGHFDNRTNMVTLLTLRAINIKYNFPVFIGMFLSFYTHVKKGKCYTKPHPWRSGW